MSPLLRTAAALAAPLLVVGLASCGASEDEEKAAASLASSLSSGGSEESESFADCAGEKIVEEVGLEGLKSDGILTEELEANTGNTQQVSEATADGMATAIIACNDWEAQGTALKENEDVPASDEEIEAYVSCMQGIDEQDFHQMVMYSISGGQHGDKEAAQRGSEAASACSSEAGLAGGAPAPESAEDKGSGAQQGSKGSGSKGGSGGG